MTTSSDALPAHPVLIALSAIEAALKDAAGVSVVFMTPAEKSVALLGAERALAGLAELQLRVLAASDDVAAEDGSRDAAAWLAHHARLDGADARRRLALAERLDGGLEVSRVALRQGDVTVAQAEVIVAAVDALPVELDPEVRVLAESHLVGLAAEHPPKQLRRLGRHILEVAAPDQAEEHARRAPEDEERRAAERTFLRFRPNGDGTTDIHARVADAIAARLRTYLEAYTSPRHRHDDDPPREATGTSAEAAPRADTDDAADRDVTGETTGSAMATEAAEPHRSYPRRLGEAFGWLLEHLDPSRMPWHGGEATAVLVTIDYETLCGRVAGHGLIGDDEVSAGEVRRLACTAGIIPAVMNGPASCSTWGGPIAWPPVPSAAPAPSSTARAGPAAARSRPPGARHTTRDPGPTAAAPTSTTSRCCAATTTTEPTTRRS